MIFVSLLREANSTSMISSLWREPRVVFKGSLKAEEIGSLQLCWFVSISVALISVPDNSGSHKIIIFNIQGGECQKNYDTAT